MTEEGPQPGLATVSRLPTAPAPPEVCTRVHAVLENTDRSVYLGSRTTDDLDPHGPVNRGHVTALLRASGDLLDIHGGVAVYVEAEPPTARSARFRLHRSAPGTDPVLTDPVSTEPSSRLCECGLSLEPPEGAEYWQPDRHPDPGPEVYAVAICGESPLARRAVRREERAGWRREGTRVGFPDYAITWKWSDLGRCGAGGLHPVRRLRP